MTPELAEYIATDPDKLGLSGLDAEDVVERMNALTQTPMVVCAELDSWLHARTVAEGNMAGWPISAAMAAVVLAGPGAANPLWPVAWTVQDWLAKAASAASTVTPGLTDAYQWLDVSGSSWETVIGSLLAGGLLTKEQIAEAQGLVQYRQSAAQVRFGRDVTLDEIRTVV